MGAPRRSSIDQSVGMALAYHGYPDAKVNEKPIFNMPKNWRFMSETEQKNIGLNNGFNTVIEDGALSNQFEILINKQTNEIHFAFKGSDAGSNWISDITNAGASEFLKLQEKAQKALEAIQQDPVYKDFHLSTSGHSLGGGMAQAFALRNNLDAHVYNSLPIARDVLKSGYFDSVGGYDEAMKTYKATDHITNDVRTPNDIASRFFYPIHAGTVGYLSDDPVVLPGNQMPFAVKMTFAPITFPVMAIDHMSASLRNSTYNLSMDEDGRFAIPKGHRHLAEMGSNLSRALTAFNDSPILEVKRVGDVFHDKDDQTKKWEIKREDGTIQKIELDRIWANISEVHKGGSRTLSEFNLAKAASGKSEIVVDLYAASGAKIGSESREVLSPQDAFEKRPGQHKEAESLSIETQHKAEPEKVSAPTKDSLANAILAAVDDPVALGKALQNAAHSPEGQSLLEAGKVEAREMLQLETQQLEAQQRELATNQTREKGMAF